MKGKDWILEVCKWIYGALIGATIFLFFCLCLDGFSYWVCSGWNPLLGQWPIFSGTRSVVFYGDRLTLIVLLVGFFGIARLVIWDRVPVMLQFLVKHPD